MKRIATALTLPLLSTLAVAAPSADGGAKWYADFDEAVAAAKEADKDLLVDFTGSDWCGWCIRLHEEVFDHDTWIDVASQEYVFVALDFPNGEEAKAAVPDPARNEELKNQYGVRGFPTIFLMNTDGVAYARTGYQAGGPTKYLEHMAQIAKAGKAAMVEVERVSTAFEEAEEGEAKWKAWDDVVGVFEGLDDNSPFLSALSDHVRWALEADPDNELGKKLIAVQALLEKGQADDTVVDVAIALDPQNELGLYEGAAQFRFSRVRDDASAKAALGLLDAINELGFKDESVGFQLNFRAAQWCSGPLADEEGCKAYAKLALAFGSDDERAVTMLEGFVD